MPAGLFRVNKVLIGCFNDTANGKNRWPIFGLSPSAYNIFQQNLTLFGCRSLRESAVEMLICQDIWKEFCCQHEKVAWNSQQWPDLCSVSIKHEGFTLKQIKICQTSDGAGKRYLSELKISKFVIYQHIRKLLIINFVILQQVRKVRKKLCWETTSIRLLVIPQHHSYQPIRRSEKS